MSDREAYRQKLEARLDEWKAQIAELEAKAKGASADARIEYDKQIDQLKEQWKDAQARLAEMSEKQGDAWSDMKAGLDAAWDDMSAAMKKAYERFS